MLAEDLLSNDDLAIFSNSDIVVDAKQVLVTCFRPSVVVNIISNIDVSSVAYANSTRLKKIENALVTGKPSY